MRSTIQVLLTSIVVLAVPSAASADVGHTVASGESLSSVAAADGLTVAQLAAANGLSPTAELITGSTLAIPPQTATEQVAAGTAAPAEPVVAAGGVQAGVAAGNDGDEAESVPSQGAAMGAGGYVVQPGDTLTAIAAANGLTVDQLAAANGLDPAGILLAGSRLAIPGATASTTQPSPSAAPSATPSAAAPATPAAAMSVAPSAGAQPTPETVSPAVVGQVAAADGVPSSLAEAIGYQESGFDNDLVSSTGATGVMQIEPGTWSYIERNLAPGSPLSPTSALDNVRGGVLLLRSLLDQTGGNASLAAAGYYQGLQSVQRYGLFRDTQRYVADVNALQQRFGGP